MNKTSIEWTDFTWNPIRARRTDPLPKSALADGPRSGTFCTRISPGCTNCYASVINKRFGTGLEYTVPNLEKHEFFIDERILAEPLKRKKPARIFVGDMFDLFHEAIPDEFIARVLVMTWHAKRHTYQFLTKRADRMHGFLSRCAPWQGYVTHNGNPPQAYGGDGLIVGSQQEWPRLNVWFGVSVEDQQRACERIPFLATIPAAVHFLSVEPQLGEVRPALRGIDWVICGGESGPGARPFNLAWAESLLEQCRAAGVPFFMKQCGSEPILGEFEWMKKTAHGWKAKAKPWVSGTGSVPIALKDGKGGDMSEWPESLRVREFPTQKRNGVAA